MKLTEYEERMPSTTFIAYYDKKKCIRIIFYTKLVSKRKAHSSDIFAFSSYIFQE